MGCSQCKPYQKKKHCLIDRIKNYIERDDISCIESVIRLVSLEKKLDFKEALNFEFININCLHLNMLSYSIYCGSSNVFLFLSEKLKASVKDMMTNLEMNNLDALMIICEKGYIDMLKVFLPIYLNLNNSADSTRQKTKKNNENSNYLSPVQAACKNGFLIIISFIESYFADKEKPAYLNIHALNEVTGENCAMISVRSGNFLMIKLLFERYQADFSVKNLIKEGCLQILIRALRDKCSVEMLECVMYLVEIVKIDITYMYEETLLLLENKIVERYLTECLKKIGITVVAEDIQNKKKMRLLENRVEHSKRSINISSIHEVSNRTLFMDSFKID